MNLNIIYLFCLTANHTVVLRFLIVYQLDLTVSIVNWVPVTKPLIFIASNVVREFHGIFGQSEK